MLRRFARRLRDGFLSPVTLQLRKVSDIVLAESSVDVAMRHPNPFARYGRKVFSQTDEDGITLEIIRRLEMDGGVFAEFGVGNGLENNTLVLAALGWRGFWVGADRLAFDPPTDALVLTYINEWVTRENAGPIAQSAMAKLATDSIDLISVDLDGNDIYVVEELLRQGLRPKVFVLEYNGRFPPPIRWQVTYDAAHTWLGDDYYGASLSSLVDLMQANEYSLVCCNSHSGANAFFVQSRFMDRFPEVPGDVSLIYAAPRFHLYDHVTYPVSARTVEAMFRRNASTQALHGVDAAGSPRR